MSPILLRRLSDELLGSRLASGEAAAFDELYRRYVHRLSAYGANLLGDAASGEDVAQSALLKAYGALRAGRVPSHLKPWLFRIAHNSAIDLVARRRELPSAELPERPAGSGEPAERSGALVAALAALPDRQRRVYVLRELHGLRIDETAAELGLTAAQVEQSLFVARNRLAEHLVFGNRLNCVAVRRLASGPLERDERRALKTHLRSCTACRATLGLRGRALGLLPVAPLDWLRGLLAGAAGTGAPVAAKVGAVVATAGFAAGIPVTADQVFQHPRSAVARAAAQAPRRQAPSPSRPTAASAPGRPVLSAFAPAAQTRHVGAPVVGREDRPDRWDAERPEAARSLSADSHDSGEVRDGGGSGRSPTSTPAEGEGQTAATPQQPTTTDQASSGNELSTTEAAAATSQPVATHQADTNAEPTTNDQPPATGPASTDQATTTASGGDGSGGGSGGGSGDGSAND